jgi:hypothetical protein
MTAELHLAENALALHLLFQRLEGLVDVVVANEYLHFAAILFDFFGVSGRERWACTWCRRSESRGSSR